MSQTVRIFQPAKTAMQSGRGKTHYWHMEFVPGSPQIKEPLMGWTASANTVTQIKLRFDSKDEAIAYAERQGFQYVIEEPHQRHLRPKSYADNFRTDRIRV